MAKMNKLDWTATALTIVGGINWGLVGFFQWNLVEKLLGTGTLTRVVYGAVGISAVYAIYSLSK